MDVTLQSGFFRVLFQPAFECHVVALAVEVREVVFAVGQLEQLEEFDLLLLGQ